MEALVSYPAAPLNSPHCRKVSRGFEDSQEKLSLQLQRTCYGKVRFGSWRIPPPPAALARSRSVGDSPPPPTRGGRGTMSRVTWGTVQEGT